MIVINNKKLEENLSLLSKAVEIVGGKYSTDISNSDDMIEEMVQAIFSGNTFSIKVNEKVYSIKELLSIKTEYEKYYLKNKNKAIEGITYKIKKYDTSLDSLIRKYKKSNSIEEYRKLYDSIEKSYRRDINNFLLKYALEENTNSAEIKDENYYGEYLLQKKKALVDNIISKLGIV